MQLSPIRGLPNSINSIGQVLYAIDYHDVESSFIQYQKLMIHRDFYQ